MLSLIVCSKNTIISDELKLNVEHTVGTEYELVVIDNSEGLFSIFQAYNEGIRRSSGDILCFMHEDIMYHTKGWGDKVEQHFKEDPALGILGAFGSRIVGGNGDFRLSPSCVSHYIQGEYTLQPTPRYFRVNKTSNRGFPRNEKRTKVAAVDGFWFCIPRELFKKDIVSFDEERFSSFHLYDADISMQIYMAGKSACIMNDILIEHKSMGFFNEDFLSAHNIFVKKWGNILPVTIGTETDIKDILRNMEIDTYSVVQTGAVVSKLRKELSEGNNLRNVIAFLDAKDKVCAINWIYANCKRAVNSNLPMVDMIEYIRCLNDVLPSKKIVKLIYKLMWRKFANLWRK